MALKNYRSESTTTFEVIQKCLAQHRVKQMFFDYEENGRIKALTFSLEIQGRLYAFRLPARVDKVERILYGERQLTETQKEQAYRTAWADIRDWVTAQMALVDTEMVKLEEIFLPYILDGQGHTYFEALEQEHFLLPNSTMAAREVTNS